VTSRSARTRSLALVAAAGLALAPDAGEATLGIGVTDGPGGAARVSARGDVAYRYQDLAGGVDRPGGWAAWNPNGTFVSRYVRESHAAGITPVLTYYTLLQSGPDRGAGEVGKDLANLADPALMRRWYADLRLALVRARQAARGRRVIVHVEPDLWGYVQQRSRGDDARTVPAAVASSGDPELAGLPDPAAGYAQALVRLRDRHAPRVTLAWHLSTWGTGSGTTPGDPAARHIDALAARSARFARSLGARFDLVFNDVADRDDGFREKVLGERPVVHHWGPGDAARHLRWVRGVTRATRTPMVLWQLPLGNRRLPNTPKRYRDNRVDLLIGSRAALHRVRAAGIVALLFGGGADGCTTAQTDGGHFFRLARAYARRPLTVR
jgi:hypothetical protein